MTEKISYTVNNKIAFSPIENTHFSGFIGDYFNRFFKNRVLSEHAKAEIFGEAEKALHEPHDDDTIVGMWSGEFWGKLEISACRVYEYTHDASLLEFVKESAYRVLSYARPDGYINSYKDSANFFAPNPDETVKLKGWRCDWNWNIWCRKYTLWGLVECAILTGDKKILDGAHRLAAQLIHELHEKHVRLGDTGTANFSGVPSGSILKPMLILYRYTGDSELLDFCVEIAEDWDRADSKRPNLIRNALENKPVHEWYPRSHLWAKAYETMSCLDGLLELYRVTGTQKYFDTVKSMYELLKQNESNVVGSVGFNDIFAHAAAWENAISEPCDVIHWIRVCTELFSLTGDAKYLNTAEKAFYNAFMASVSDDGTWGARGVRSSGRHFMAEGQSGCKHNHCCVDNIPRGFLNFTSSAVMSDENGLYITEFCPFTYENQPKNIQITCSDGYLETGCVSLDVKNEMPLTLRIRVPECAGAHAFLVVNGEKIPLTRGEFYGLSLKESAQIDLNFDFFASVCDFPGLVDVDSLPKGDFRIDRWIWEDTKERGMPRDSMMNKPCSFITYGPLVLARSKKLGTPEEAMFFFDSIHGKGAAAKVKAVADKNANVLCQFDVTLIENENSQTIEMCDYGTAADNFSNIDQKFFNLYL